MRYLLTICAIAWLALSGALVVAGVAPDAALGQLDFFRPATFLPVVAAGVHEVHRCVRDWVDTTLGDLRDVLQRTKLREALPQ
jgi:hypothetical protein